MTVSASGLRTARMDNPLCGDRIEISFGIVDGLIRPAGHRAQACSLVIASANVLATVVAGRTPAEARALGERIDRALRRADTLPEGCEALAPVVLLPTRRRCALLPWQALAEGLDTP